MERQHAKTILLGTLLLLLALAVGYYLLFVYEVNDGYRGIMVDACRGLLARRL